MPILAAIHSQRDMEITAVVTQPDRPVGRKQILTPPPIKKLAEELNLKVLQPKNQKELLQILKNMETDFFVVIAYGMIFPKEILKKPKFGAINIHFSTLPKYRGASPIQEALLHGDKETGISIIKIDEELDHGDIYFLKRIPIAEKDNFPSLSKKLSEEAARISPHVLRDIANRTLKPIAQNHVKTSYCHKISKKDGEINWQKTAEEIKNMIRAYNPWPGTYTTLKGKKIKILEATADGEKIKSGVFKLQNNVLKIGTSKGSLIPQTLQMEGKKPTGVQSFINGYKNLFY